MSKWLQIARIAIEMLEKLFLKKGPLAAVAGMLDKAKAGLIVGLVLSVVKMLLPALEIPEGLPDALITVIDFFWSFILTASIVFSFWKTKESRAKLARLKTKP